MRIDLYFIGTWHFIKWNVFDKMFIVDVLLNDVPKGNH